MAGQVKVHAGAKARFRICTNAALKGRSSTTPVGRSSTLHHASERLTAATVELVLERDYGAAVAAEGGDFLQVAVGAGHGHDRPVAVDGVPAGGEVPAPAFGTFADLSGGLPQRFLRQ